ncbi:uncharacterized protein LOC144882687 [Branchiostoma floridae x Branchiostoma japonicum]
MANILDITSAIIQDHGAYASWGVFFLLVIAVVICLNLIFTCASCKNEESETDSVEIPLRVVSHQISFEQEQDMDQSNEEHTKQDSQGQESSIEDHESIFLFDQEKYNRHSDVETIKLTKKNDEHRSLTIFEEIGQFKRLKKVTIVGLKLDGCSLSNLFQCTSIEHLSLTDCSIESIPISLTNLKDLKTLHLSNNNLTSIPLGSRHPMPNLSILNLSHNKIPAIGDVARGLQALQTFDMSYNEMEEFPHEILYMKSLEVFFCSHNKIARWLEQPTAGQQGKTGPLAYLDLSNNFLEDVPQCVKELKNLKTLNMSHNKITVIGHIVMKLDTLENLDMSFNDIEEIPYGILQMEKLKELHCNHNKIARWPEPSDEGRKTKICHLEVLNLSNNSLEVVPGLVKELEDLLEVDLSCNKIGANVRDETSDGLAQLFYLPSVSSLMLGNNNIKTLPQLDMTKVSTNISKIDFSSNKFGEVPAALLSMPTLKALYLGGNKITNFPADLDLNKLSPTLRVIDLSNNELDDLPLVLCLLPSLEKLDLKQNKINSMSENVKSCKNLSFLDVSHNRLKEIPSYLFGLPELKQILASNNQITSVSSLQKDESPEMEVVALAENGLSQFPEALIQMKKLKKVDLSNNEIKFIPKSVMDMPKDVKLNLDGNPLIDPPLEVYQEGVQAIQTFYEDLTTASGITHCLKILVLGTYDAGKTSLVRVLQQDRSRLTKPEERTHGVEITELHLSVPNNPNITLSVWDFAGQETYYITHQFFLSAKALMLLVVNLEKYDSASFNSTCGDWMENMIAKVGNPVVIPVATHTDKLSTGEVKRRCEYLAKKLADQERLRIKDLERQLRRIEESLPHVESSQSKVAVNDRKKQIEALLQKRPVIHQKPVPVSSGTNLEGIHYLKQVILDYAVNKEFFPEVGRPVPKAWADTEACVERKGKELDVPYMTWDEFTSLLKENVPNLQPESRIKTVAQYLHDTGKILWYSEIESLQNHVFLKPASLVDIFRKVIRHDLERVINYGSDSCYKEAGITRAQFDTMKSDMVRKGILHTKLLRCLWSDIKKKCSPGTFDAIFNVLIELMRQFDLCYDLEIGQSHGHTGENQRHPLSRRLLLPWHIKGDADEGVMTDWGSAGGPIISLQYQFPSFIPPGLFARLTVRAHRPEHNLHFVGHWKTGTLCKHKKYRTLLLLKNEGTKGLAISLSARREIKNPHESDYGRNPPVDKLWETLKGISMEVEGLLKQWPGLSFIISMKNGGIRLANPQLLGVPDEDARRTASTKSNIAPGSMKTHSESLRDPKVKEKNPDFAAASAQGTEVTPSTSDPVETMATSESKAAGTEVSPTHASAKGTAGTPSTSDSVETMATTESKAAETEVNPTQGDGAANIP